MSATLVSPTKPKRAARRSGGLGELWRVIVLNDDRNTFEGVARALSSVLPDVSYDAGMRLAEEIDKTGQAIVWGGHREVAELYWAQLEGLDHGPARILSASVRPRPTPVAAIETSTGRSKQKTRSDAAFFV